jgi:hypothetical protein
MLVSTDGRVRNLRFARAQIRTMTQTDGQHAPNPN